jgi:hypothetical protein
LGEQQTATTFERRGGGETADTKLYFLRIAEVGEIILNLFDIAALKARKFIDLSLDEHAKNW